MKQFIREINFLLDYLQQRQTTDDYHLFALAAIVFSFLRIEFHRVDQRSDMKKRRRLLPYRAISSSICVLFLMKTKKKKKDERRRLD